MYCSRRDRFDGEGFPHNEFSVDCCFSSTSSSDSSDSLAVPRRITRSRRAPDKNVGSEPPQILAPTANLKPFLSSVSTTSGAERRLDIQQRLQRVVVGFQFHS